MAIAGAALCVLRARFFRFDVRRFGTAIVVSVSGDALLLRSFPQGAQRIPAALGDRRAAARAFVQISAAPRAQAAAPLTALRETRRGEQPLLTRRRSEIQFSRVRRDDEHVRIVRALGTSLRKQEVDRLTHLDRGGLKAAPARHLQCAGEPTAEVITIAARAREATGNPYAINRPCVVGFPHAVVAGKRTVDYRGARLERPNVNGQHSR